MSAGVSAELAQGVSVKETLSSVMAELKDHEYAALGNDVLNFVSGAGSLPADPAAAQRELIDAGLSFLTGLIQPLQQCLNMVTGDADSLHQKALQWQQLATDLRATVPEITQLADSTRSSWSGAAAAAFDRSMADFTQTVAGAAASCDTVVLLLQISADLMTGARALIMDIVRQLIEYMIVTEAAGAAASAFTLGASEATAQAAVIGQTADGVERAIAIVDRVTALLQRIGTALQQISSVFGRVGTLIEQLTKQTGALTRTAQHPSYSQEVPEHG